MDPSYLKTHKIGFDLEQYTEVSLKDFLKTKGNIVLATSDGKPLCISHSLVKSLYKDKEDKWMYECYGEFIPGTRDRSMAHIAKNRPYVKMYVSESGMIGLVPAPQVKGMVESKRKLFFIKPHIVDDVHYTLTHTIGHALAYNTHGATMVSANHCQYGSNMLVYDILEQNSKRFKFSSTSRSSDLDNSDTRSTRISSPMRPTSPSSPSSPTSPTSPTSPSSGGKPAGKHKIKSPQQP